MAKLWYFQEGGLEKHLRDIAAMLQVSGELINTELIDHWALQLGVTSEWQIVMRRLRDRQAEQPEIESGNG